jgi:SPP1 family phage portal protein
MEYTIEDIKKMLTDDPKEAIVQLRKETKARELIDSYIDEYKQNNRNQRPGQVDRIQRDKGETKAVRIHLNHQKNIVETLAAFICGRPVNLVPSKEGKLHSLIKQLWRVNRMDSKVLKALMTRMSETQVGLHFYIQPIKDTSVLNKVLKTLGLAKQKNEIKTKVLNNEAGTMTPFFDAYDDMILFMWEYQTIDGTKTTNHIQIWDDKNYYHLSDEIASLVMVEDQKPHGFDRIPIVYDQQHLPEWYPVRSAIDRHEVALSKLGDSTDYSGHPILVTVGKVSSLPTKNETGKHFNIPRTYDDEGKDITGEAKFLEAKNAPELNKLEIDRLEDAISHGSGVPNLSLDKLKALGNVAEKTVKLMFLGTELKAEMRRSETRTFIDRCINVLVSGVITTTNTSLKEEGSGLYYDIIFNSILPNDVNERVNVATKAVNSGLMSKRTGVSIIDLADDVTGEIEMIDKESAERERNKISGEGGIDPNNPGNPREPNNDL